MKIVLFAIVEMSKFDKKHNKYTKCELVLQHEPLSHVGLVASCFDASIGLDIEVLMILRDKHTKHMPEDGIIDGLPLVKQLNKHGLWVYSIVTPQEFGL